MKETGMTLEEHYSAMLGIEMQVVKIEKLEDVFSGKDLEKAMRFKENFCTKGNCHYNSGLATDWVYDKYDVSFCEGLAGEWAINHCWNCLTDKETGEKRYVDYTLNNECEAYLFAEWSRKDIWALFNTCKYAFIPHRDMWNAYGKNKAMKLIEKHYPNMAVSA